MFGPDTKKARGKTVTFKKKEKKVQAQKERNQCFARFMPDLLPKIKVSISNTQVSICEMCYRVLHFKYGQVGTDAQDTLVICGWLVYLWRGQLPQGRSKGSSLANPACNKQYNSTLLQTKLTSHLFLIHEKFHTPLCKRLNSTELS